MSSSSAVLFGTGEARSQVPAGVGSSMVEQRPDVQGRCPDTVAHLLAYKLCCLLLFVLQVAGPRAYDSSQQA